MGLYQRKPVVINAEQWLPDGRKVHGVCAEKDCYCKKHPHIHTFDPCGNTIIKIVREKDWIIKEETMYYVCNQDVFEATYVQIDSFDQDLPQSAVNAVNEYIRTVIT